MWLLSEDGRVATKRYGDKIKVRVISDGTGTHWHEYDDTFKMIGAGVVISVKHGMEKFNAY